MLTTDLAAVAGNGTNVLWQQILCFTGLSCFFVFVFFCEIVFYHLQKKNYFAVPVFCRLSGFEQGTVKERHFIVIS